MTATPVTKHETGTHFNKTNVPIAHQIAKLIPDACYYYIQA